MKLKRLSDSRLQIIISNKDLLARNMKKWDLVPHSVSAQALFKEILEKAALECDFTVVQDMPLLIEAYPITGDSLLLTLTKVSDKESSLSNILSDDIKELFDEKFKDESSQTTSESSIAFDNLEAIYEYVEHELEDSIINGKLYYDNVNKVYLFQKIFPEDAYSDKLMEYGDKIEVNSSYLAEYCSLIISDNALEKFKVI